MQEGTSKTANTAHRASGTADLAGIKEHDLSCSRSSTECANLSEQWDRADLSSNFLSLPHTWQASIWKLQMKRALSSIIVLITIVVSLALTHLNFMGLFQLP